MNEPLLEANPIPVTFEKEAYTGIKGRLCRYAGDADRGIHIELAPGNVLKVTLAQS